MYHISREYLGDYVYLTPSIPQCRNEKEDEHNERVCVAPTVEGCILGMYGSDTMQESCERMMEDDACYQNWFLYKCSDDYVYKPTKKQVPDVLVTDEYWVMDERGFKYVGEVFVTENDKILVTKHGKNVKVANKYI